MAPSVKQAEKEARTLGKQALRQTVVNALGAVFAYTLIRLIIAAGAGAGLGVLVTKIFG